MVLLRHLLGDALRRLRLRQGRTLREVSASARVSLGYLSEVERGQKEASSELLAAICTALGAPLSQVLREVSDNFALVELQTEPVFANVIEPAIEVTTSGHQVDRGENEGPVPVGQVGSVGPVGPTRMVGVPGKMPDRVAMQPGAQLRAGHGQVPVAQKVGVSAGSALPISAGLDDPVFDQVARVARQITDMVPV
jgi:transcriptional regulator with XRE-family HTH domain